MTSRPRIFIAGSSGFLGSALKNYLSSRNYPVFGADLHISRGEKKFWRIDLLKKGEIIGRLKECLPEYIFHVAGLVGSEDENALYLAHVETTKALFLAVRAVAPSARILVLGSAAEYGGNHKIKSPIKEGSQATPETAYGRSKLAQSELALQLSRELQLDVIRVRLFNSIGPGQGPELVAGAMVKRLFKCLVGGSKVFDVYDPFSVRDFLDIRDIARLLCKVIFYCGRNPERAPIHIASGEGVPIGVLAHQLISIAGIDDSLKVRLMPSPTTSICFGEPSTLTHILGNDRIRRFSLFDSLRDMWIWELNRNS